VRPPLFLTKLLIRTGIARLLPGVQRRMQGGADFLHYYGDRLLAAPLDDLALAAEALRPQTIDVIDLTAGAPRFDGLAWGPAAPAGGRHGWPVPEGLPELRQAVAEKLLGEDRLAFHPSEEVLITAGGLGALHVALDAFVNPGDRVALFDPCSPLYPLAVRSRRARPRWIPTWVEEGRLRFRLHHLAGALRGARLLVLNSPANPTGGIIHPEDLEQVAWWARRYDVLLLSDEVLACYASRDEVVSIASLATAHRRTLVAGSLSKSHGLAGARVGWLAGYRHLLRPCRIAAGLHIPFVPTPCQHLAVQALRAPVGPVEAARERLQARRQPACERLAAAGLEASPGSGLFLWLDVGAHGPTGRAFADRLLRENKVRISPGDLFGPSGATHVRISLAGDEGRLYEGLGRLADFVRPAGVRAKVA
jgi:aspartate/methionine/tyrosine aminotransferase